ncbi:unnamed protein product, partial [marine sediment metagenome]
YVQEFIKCDGIERKIYVIGDKVFGIKRENPIYIYLRDKPENIDVGLIEREKFEITKDILSLSKILSKELNLKIFGFDLVKPIDNDKYYLIDLNDFPSFKGIPMAELELKNFIEGGQNIAFLKVKIFVLGLLFINEGNDVISSENSPEEVFSKPSGIESSKIMKSC